MDISRLTALLALVEGSKVFVQIGNYSEPVPLRSFEFNGSDVILKGDFVHLVYPENVCNEGEGT